MATYRELQLRARDLGIKIDLRSNTKTLENAIFKEEVDILNRAALRKSSDTVTSKNKSPPISPRSKSPRSMPTIKSLNVGDAEILVFSGSHIFLDNDMLETLQEKLKKEFSYDPIRILFYNDGDQLVSTDEPDADDALRVYKEALAVNTNYGFSEGAIAFDSSFFTLELHNIVNDVLSIGGFSFPNKITLISSPQSTLGDIVVYYFDTYV